MFTLTKLNSAKTVIFYLRSSPDSLFLERVFCLFYSKALIYHVLTFNVDLFSISIDYMPHSWSHMRFLDRLVKY